MFTYTSVVTSNCILSINIKLVVKFSALRSSFGRAWKKFYFWKYKQFVFLILYSITVLVFLYKCQYKFTFVLCILMVHFATDQITGIKCILLAQPTSQNSGLLHCLVCFVSNSHVHMDFVYLGLKLKNNNNIIVHTLCAQSTHTIIAQADEINFVAIKIDHDSCLTT